MDTPHLLPVNATPQERVLSQTLARLSDVTVPVRNVWNQLTCPPDLLPWLAWAFSVDTWDADWTETRKRQVIARSLDVHRKKGTIGALRTALEPFALNLVVEEWWEFGGDPYTFRVTVTVDNETVDQAVLDELEAVINDAKNVRSHLAAINTATGASYQTPVWAMAATASDVVTIYPREAV